MVDLEFSEQQGGAHPREPVPFDEPGAEIVEPTDDEDEVIEAWRAEQGPELAEARREAIFSWFGGADG